uniref:Uncharacterized protein n=1 Tax=Romanomermis culicivorax TaxID=13658 RepID=A0A915HKM4_ROMCU
MDDKLSLLSIKPAIINTQSKHFPVVVIDDSNETIKVIEYVPGKGNAFAEFLSQKFEVDKTTND